MKPGPFLAFSVNLVGGDRFDPPFNMVFQKVTLLPGVDPQKISASKVCKSQFLSIKTRCNLFLV